MSEVVEGLVSTIIPVYNRPRMLHEAVESVLAQTYRPIEIIISDDGSTDEAGREADRMAAEHPGVIHVVHGPNQGPGPAREAGRQRACGEFIQYLDSDDRLLPCKFDVQVSALRAHGECGIAYGRTRWVNMDGGVLRDPFKWTGRAIPFLFPRLLIDRWWCTHTPLYRRALCDAIGSWSDLRYSQDWEYDARAGARRVQLSWCDELVSEHRQHSGVRQTGNGRWLAPPDRVRFFRLLHRHAQAAGVARNCPEMRHFSSWVFLHARQCGEAGDAAASRACLELAAEAAGAWRGDLRFYRVLALTLGWVAAARLSSWVITRTGRRPGVNTLTLSSAPEAPPDA